MSVGIAPRLSSAAISILTPSCANQILSWTYPVCRLNTEKEPWTELHRKRDSNALKWSRSLSCAEPVKDSPVEAHWIALPAQHLPLGQQWARHRRSCSIVTAPPAALLPAMRQGHSPHLCFSWQTHGQGQEQHLCSDTGLGIAAAETNNPISLWDWCNRLPLQHLLCEQASDPVITLLQVALFFGTGSPTAHISLSL